MIKLFVVFVVLSLFVGFMVFYAIPTMEINEASLTALKVASSVTMAAVAGVVIIIFITVLGAVMRLLRKLWGMMRANRIKYDPTRVVDNWPEDYPGLR